MNEAERRKVVVDKWLENTNRPHRVFAKELKMQRRSVETILNRYFETLSVSRKPKDKKEIGGIDARLDKAIVKTIRRNRNMSTRDVGKKCKTTQPMVQRRKKRAGLKTYKK